MIRYHVTKNNLMFSIFKRKAPAVTDINWLGVDLHSHLLPGIDDGSPDLKHSLYYITKLNELGIEKFYCTPHIFSDLYPNTPKTILQALKDVNEGLKVAGKDIFVEAAAEHMVDYGFEVKDNLLALPHNHILIEMSYLSETPNIEEVIFALQVKGYKVVLAHPERYNFYHQNTARYNRLKEMGCLFQLNLLSVVGYYGKGVKQAADSLLQQKMYDVAGTDLHHDKHLSVMDRAVKSGEMFKILGNYEFKNRELFL